MAVQYFGGFLGGKTDGFVQRNGFRTILVKNGVKDFSWILFRKNCLFCLCCNGYYLKITPLLLTYLLTNF